VNQHPPTTVAELHAKDVSRSASGALTGTLYLKLGDCCFPDADWSDFVVVVLEWWCSALHRLHQSEPGPITVPFMDGPFRVVIESLDDGRLEVTLMTHGENHEQEINHAIVDRNKLTNSAVVTARGTLRQCRQHGWSSKDVDALSESLDALVNCMTFGSA
jgi:hypothetical protein